MHTSRAQCKDFCKVYHELQKFIRVMPRSALQAIKSQKPSIKPTRIIMTRTLLCIDCFKICADEEFEDEEERVCAHFQKAGHSFCE